MDISISDNGDMGGDSGDKVISSAAAGVVNSDVSAVTSNGVPEGCCSIEDCNAVASELGGNKDN